MSESVEVNGRYTVEVQNINMAEWDARSLSPDVDPSKTYVTITQRVMTSGMGSRSRMVEQEVWMTLQEWMAVDLAVRRLRDQLNTK